MKRSSLRFTLYLTAIAGYGIIQFSGTETDLLLYSQSMVLVILCDQCLGQFDSASENISQRLRELAGRESGARGESQ